MKESLCQSWNMHRSKYQNGLDVRASCFVSGRDNDWAKKPCARRKTLTVAGFAWTASERLSQRFARPEGEPLRHMRRALGAPRMTQQLFPLSARRQTPSLDAILSRLLRQPVLKRHRLTDSAPSFEGFRDGFVGGRAAHDALLEKAVSSGRRDRRSTGRPESVPLRAVELVAREVATCC